MRSIAIICCLLFMGKMTAQKIYGRLVDENQIPIEGAYIFNIQSESHAHTNELGTFRIKESQIGDTLRIGALGYSTILVPLQEKSYVDPLEIELEESALELGEVVVRPKTNALSVLSAIDLKVRPVGSSQEILQKVPGLVIGQHAGGGKAEQLFLRGFDIDHGTDIALAVDGMPVNMVSHAHGQGYSDLHFVIPETIDNIDFNKGPYTADKGNFATAGHVDFKTKEVLENNRVGFDYGEFGWNRGLGMFNLLKTKKDKAYVAGELLRFDGPFESSQNFSRVNLFGKYTKQLWNDAKLSMGVSYFTSKWDASGQIPERAVNSGRITRFGAIDDTEGGTTSRSSVTLKFQKPIGKQGFITSNAFFSRYDFDLFSNFTFFLVDRENGDQIVQRESRNLFGFNTVLNQNIEWGDIDLRLRAGVGLRTDMVQGNELSRTLNRGTVLQNIQLGDVRESNFNSFLEGRIEFGKYAIVPGIRLDHFRFGYLDNLRTDQEEGKVKKTRLSPKLNFLFDPTENLQLFLKTGIGFHSNDARVSVSQNGEDVLPAAYGVDLGSLFRINSKIFVNSALWYLHLDQEFVYVGDAGIVEPSGRSERYGLDMGLRYQISDRVFFDSDLTYTVARSKDEPRGINYIPLAPDFTASGGVTFYGRNKFSGGIRYRYLDDRPANEDNSIVAEGYFVVDANANYELSKGLTLGLSIQNLFNTDWNETQFATLSQLRNESQPTEEIHFTPGAPFTVRASLQYRF
ncbi:TonB-dependent receptor [Flagellimonas allohymeniacidonis]|uniref:TonB-dependent receptor n=1 Tax=Flagellimonas allohymeniacidonis TaxID=2517819 RepID=A0A4Q8QFN3_9FLAO|nr:TonB-dependent receptor [Allomuricauda hymeniacidonis]TAI48517.1 TonB-dependent receptor [Allomuricauda hymeniacidonis]